MSATGAVIRTRARVRGNRPGSRFQTLRVPDRRRGGPGRIRAQRRARGLVGGGGRAGGGASIRPQAERRRTAPGPGRTGAVRHGGSQRRAGLSHPGQCRLRAARRAGQRRHRHLCRLPDRAAGLGRPPLPLPVHQLHELRSAVHDRTGRPLRSAADHDGTVCHVRRVPPRVRRPARSALPRSAERLPALRSAIARAGLWRVGHRARPERRTRSPGWPPGCGPARSWP